MRMKMSSIRVGLVAAGALAGTALLAAAQQPQASAQDAYRPVAPESGEVHLRNIRQLTFGGQNAEAYFSASGRLITFQSTRDGHGCDQQYVMNADGSAVHRISNGRARTASGSLYHHDRRAFYASAFGADSAWPP